MNPSHVGPLVASAAVTDDTAGSPHQIALSGTGEAVGPNATLSTGSLTFLNENVNSTSAPIPITLINYGSVALNVTGIAATANFGASNSCVGSLAPVATCTIKVTFTPNTTGVLTGTLSVTDDAPGSPQTASLSGTGIVSKHTLTGYC